MIAFILVAQIAAVTAAAPAPASSLDSLRASADNFVRTWRFYWESSEVLRNGNGRERAMKTDDVISRLDAAGRRPLSLSLTDSLRLYEDPLRPLGDPWQYQHCHPEWGDLGQKMEIEPPAQTPFVNRGTARTTKPPSAAASSFRRVNQNILRNHGIPSGVGKRAVCPAWFPDAIQPPWNERDGIDGSLVKQAREPVRTARASLLDRLDSAAARHPGDPWIVGQRIRFSLDQADTSRAERAVATCSAGAWWCAMLRGYVDAARGRIRDADLAYGAAIAAMPDSTRCRMTDLELLLPDSSRAAYLGVPCAGRAALNERIWWLSDGLWIDDFNDRRVAHYSRVTEIELLRGTALNERLDLRDEGGGRAAREMLVRYGRPTLSQWGAQQNDVGHFGYLGVENDSMMDHGRFVTAEYAKPRVHTVPSWRAIDDPFHAGPLEWTLNESALRHLDSPVEEWWPTEHYDRGPGPMVQLLDHQQAFFRRDQGALFALATNFYAADVAGATGDTLKGALIFSTAADSIRRVGKGVVIGYGAPFRELVESRPQMVGIEMFGRRPAGTVARTRFGIQPPPSLASMRPGECAISDVALVEAVDGAMPSSDPDVALARMQGTTAFADLTRFGIYWETYGIAAGDTVDVAISVTRLADEGLVRRIAVKIGIAGRSDGGVTVLWREPSTSYGAWIRDGRIPIQGRGVFLNTSRLEPGRYALTVSVTPIGGAPLESTRAFAILAKRKP